MVLLLIFTAKPILWRPEAPGAFAFGPSHQGKAFSALHRLCPSDSLGLDFAAMGPDVGKLRKRVWYSENWLYTQENLWRPLDPSSLEMCVESPLKYLLLGLGLYCCCLIAWAVVQRNGVLLLFSFYPQRAAFLPLFYLPSSQIIPVIFCFPNYFVIFPISGGPCHFKTE